MKLFALVFLLTASALLAQSQEGSVSEQESSPLMMFSFWSSKKTPEQRREDHLQRQRTRDEQTSRSAVACNTSSSALPRESLSLGATESNADQSERYIEFVTFTNRNLRETRSSDLLHDQQLEEQKKSGLEVVIQSLMASLPAGDRLPQPGEDSKLVAVFNKYKNLFLAAYEKRAKQLPLILSYQEIMMHCERGLNAGAKARGLPWESFERNALNNVVVATKKLLSLKVPLIAADASKNLNELRRLVPRVKACEDVADLRVQIVDAFEQGKTDVVQRLIANDPSEIIEKIERYQSLRHAVRSSGLLLDSEYKKIIKTYQELLASRRESAHILAQGAVYPEVSQAWLDVEKSYLMLIDWQARAAKCVEANPTWRHYNSIDYNGNIADTHRQAVHYRINAARAAAMGQLEEAVQCSEAAAVCEKLVGIKNLIIRQHDVGQLLPRFNSLSCALNKLATKQMLLNKVLSPEINGTRSWKSREASDFNKRLGAIFPSSGKKLLNSIGEEELQRQLLHDLEVTQKEVDARTNALRLDDAEHAPLLRQRLVALWMKAAECYEEYGYNKSKFYTACYYSSERDRGYLLKYSEYFEQEGECYARAIEILSSNQDNKEEVARRWLDIASLRQLMILEHVDKILNQYDSLVQIWQRCDEIINFKTQAIEAILNGDSVEAIALLDHQIEQREPAAKAQINWFRQLAYQKYHDSLPSPDGGIGPG